MPLYTQHYNNMYLGGGLERLTRVSQQLATNHSLRGTLSQTQISDLLVSLVNSSYTLPEIDRNSTLENRIIENTRVQDPQSSMFLGALESIVAQNVAPLVAPRPRHNTRANPDTLPTAIPNEYKINARYSADRKSRNMLLEFVKAIEKRDEAKGDILNKYFYDYNKVKDVFIYELCILDKSTLIYRYDNKNDHSKKVMMKATKFLSKVYSTLKLELTTADSELFISIINENTENYEFKLLSTMEELKYAYSADNYVENSGSLDDSCMKYSECQRYFEIYKDAKVLVLTLNNEIYGRALIWENVITSEGNIKIMDRIYVADYNYVYLFTKYASQNGYEYKNRQIFGNDAWEQNSLNKTQKIIKTYLDKEVDLFPYLDTFRYIYLCNRKKEYKFEYLMCANPDKRLVNNNEYTFLGKCTKTNGEIRLIVFCDICGEEIDTIQQSYRNGINGEYYCCNCFSNTTYVSEHDCYTH